MDGRIWCSSHKCKHKISQTRFETIKITNCPQIFNQSLVSIFGLLFSQHLTDLGQTTIGVALVMNLNSVVLNLSGLLTGPAIKATSPRTVHFIGSLLTGSGLILSSFTTSLWQLLLSYGVFVGLGLGLISSSTFIAVNSYFSLKRGRAVGLALAGTGLGQMLMPQIIGFLLNKYGFRGATLIVGGLALHGLIGACLSQPVRRHYKDREFCERRQLIEKEKKTETPAPKITFLRQIINAMDLEFLKDLTFLNISFGLALAYTASINFSLLFPYFLQQDAGLSLKNTATCMSTLAGADLLSRLTFPSITDRFKISCRMVFLFGAICLAFVRELLVASADGSLQSIMIVSGVYGYIRAMCVVNQSLSISEYCSQEKLPGALGLNMVIKGIFVITVGQLLGWIRDYFQSYSLCLEALNILIIIIVIFWVPEIIYKKCKKKIQIDDELNNLI